MTEHPELRERPSVLALSGGIGGAKLALGLYHVLEPWQLAVAVNTGDDFSHIGLHIAPDVDTVMYTLAGQSNPERGWGRAGETWNFMDQFGQLGGDTWFNLGDGDLAVHLRRQQLLDAGIPLSQITARFCGAKGIHAHIWPASDEPVRTIIHTADERELPFQVYFVEEKCKPQSRGFSYTGADSARPNQGLVDALADPSLRAVIICPSNPFVSIDPILAIPGNHEALRACRVPIVAVSPIVGGSAVKGPLAKMLGELGLPVSSCSILNHYQDFLSGIVIDEIDAELAASMDMPTLVAPTVMGDLDDKTKLARAVLDFADELAMKNR